MLYLNELYSARDDIHALHAIGRKLAVHDEARLRMIAQRVEKSSLAG